MSVASVDILELRIPFRFRYGHAKAKHQAVESVLCIARDAEGREGYGEAVPRAYVTGESTASIQQTLPVLVSQYLGESYATFQEKLTRIETSWPDAVPGCALCALDLAVTDLQARQKEESVVTLLGGRPGELTYTASIGMGSRAKLTALLLLYKAMGFRRFKVKVGDAHDGERVRLIRRILGREVSLFADANGAWNREAAVDNIEELAKYKIWAVEEPLKISHPSERFVSGQLCREDEITDQHLADCAWVQARSPVPLIADESLISLRVAGRIVDAAAFKIFNIRLSKCGGYLRSAQFAELADQAGLKYSLGAMVGESPVLAAAGLAWGTGQPGRLYIQGHSHRMLHGIQFVQGCPPLRRGGECTPGRGLGAGLDIDPSALERVVVKRQRIEVG